MWGDRHSRTKLQLENDLYKIEKLKLSQKILGSIIDKKKIIIQSIYEEKSQMWTKKIKIVIFQRTKENFEEFLGMEEEKEIYSLSVQVWCRKDKVKMIGTLDKKEFKFVQTGKKWNLIPIKFHKLNFKTKLIDVNIKMLIYF